MRLLELGIGFFMFFGCTTQGLLRGLFEMKSCGCFCVRIVSLVSTRPSHLTYRLALVPPGNLLRSEKGGLAPSRAHMKVVTMEG